MSELDHQKLAEFTASKLAHEGTAGASFLIIDDENGGIFQRYCEGAERWVRRTATHGTLTPWPAGPFTTILYAWPKDKAEQHMMAHILSGLLQEGGRLLIYGLKNAGIQSAPSVLQDYFGKVETVLIKFHGRLLVAEQPKQSTKSIKFEHWQKFQEYELAPEEIISLGYLPGMFAAGHIDPASRLLMELMPVFPAGTKVLDYGAGGGLLSLAVRHKEPSVKLTLLDHDRLALMMAMQNVPEARYLWDGDLRHGDLEKYDRIISNPPLHRGAHYDTGMLQHLMLKLPELLARQGEVWLVTQQTVPIPRWIPKAYQAVLMGEREGFRVWRIVEAN
jgi:16S rRNA (guanine1207-N2)-methyltransferase